VTVLISRKTAVRVIAAILALLLIGGVLITAFQVFATDSLAGVRDSQLSENSPGDSFEIIALIVFFIALAVLVTFGILYFIKKRKKQ